MQGDRFGIIWFLRTISVSTHHLCNNAEHDDTGLMLNSKKFNYYGQRNVTWREHVKWWAHFTIYRFQQPQNKNILTTILFEI